MKLILLPVLLLAAPLASWPALRGPDAPQESAPDGAVDHKATIFPFPAEPALRARLVVDGVALDLPLDGRSVSTPTGRTLSAQLLSTRRLEITGTFAFEYPQAWRYQGSAAAEGAALAWWSIGTMGAFVGLQRHDGDAEAIREQYLHNSRASGATDLAPVQLDLDGRTLDGTAFEMEGVTVGLGPRYHWHYEVYAFEQGGASWLLTLQLGSKVVEPGLSVPFTLELPSGTPSEGTGETEGEAPAVASVAALAVRREQMARLGPLAPVVASFSWLEASAPPTD